MSPITLFCLVYDDPNADPFEVNIDRERTISVLKDAIKERRKPAFDHLPADHLRLWKWNKPTDKVEGLDPRDLLDSRTTIGDVFENDSPQRALTHIIVKAPCKIFFSNYTNLCSHLISLHAFWYCTGIDGRHSSRAYRQQRQ